MARIPLQPETTAARALSLTVTALMVALGMLALAGAAALRHVDLTWRAALADRWTAELPPRDPDTPVPDADVARAAAALAALPGIVDARPIPPEEIKQLLAPWLGDAPLPPDLPLPALIDLTIRPDARPDPAALTRAAGSVWPGIRIDDHGAWTRQLADLARTGEVLGIALFAVIAFTTALSIAAAARARLAINRPEIELMHTIGATDGYIARQFQAGAFRAALLGALIGAVLAAGALAGLLAVGQAFAPLMPALALDPLDGAALAAVPVAAIVLATVVARNTAIALLRRLP